MQAYSSDISPKKTILGARAPRMPVGGVVRVGMKVLTKAAASNPVAQGIYEKGVQAQEPFETIEARIKQAVPNLNSVLVPRNTPWFVVRRGDFPNPDIADQIMEKYGEVREDGVRRLWSLPVVFPLDRWEDVMPHAYQCFTGEGLKYWSEYGQDGQLQCMTFAKVKVNAQTQKAMKLSGGRDHVLREDNGGACDPDECHEYQIGQCKLRGRLQFFIPGIPTIDLVEIRTGSINGLEGARVRMEMIAAARQGRLSGFLDDESATFFMTKKLMQVPGIDEKTGQPIRREQWIPVLSANLDITTLYKRPALIDQAAKAAALLQGPVAEVQPLQVGMAAPAEGEADQGPGVIETQAQAPAEAPVTHAAPVREVKPEEIEVIPGTAGREVRTGAGLAAGADPVDVLLGKLEVDAERFEKYAKRKWGAWKANPKGRERVLQVLEGHLADPSAFREDVASVLEEVV